MIHQGVFGAIAGSAQVIQGGGSADGVAYIASQTSAYSSSTVASYANLTDTNGTTGGATNASSVERIIATFPNPVLVSSVIVGGGNLPTWGAVATYLNTRLIQYSVDGTLWVDVLTMTGVTDSGANQFKTFTLATPITAQYWCLFHTGFLATTELRFS